MDGEGAQVLAEVTQALEQVAEEMQAEAETERAEETEAAAMVAADQAALANTHAAAAAEAANLASAGTDIVASELRVLREELHAFAETHKEGNIEWKTSFERMEALLWTLIETLEETEQEETEHQAQATETQPLLVVEEPQSVEPGVGAEEIPQEDSTTSQQIWSRIFLRAR
jgi:hypothetical protein